MLRDRRYQTNRNVVGLDTRSFSNTLRVLIRLSYPFRESIISQLQGLRKASGIQELQHYPFASRRMNDLQELELNSLFSVAGWTALVTGGGTGLGLMTAKALAQNGAKVYVTGRRADVLEKARTRFPRGGEVIPLVMDVTNKQDILKAVTTIAADNNALHLLVNNAGVTTARSNIKTCSRDPEAIRELMFDGQDFEDWSKPYLINVASIYFCSAAFLPLLVKGRQQFDNSGSIINISSMSGITKESQGGQFSYNASKAACISLTEQLACDFAQPGLEIRVNTLAPGYFPSEMTTIKERDGTPEHFRKEWGIPLGRPGRARDYAQAILNFAVNGYVTGATLIIDGAWLLTHA